MIHALCLAALSAFQEPTVQATSPSEVRHHIVESEPMSGERLVSVWLPENYDPARQHTPIYVLDAKPYLQTVAGNVDFLVKAGALPPAIVVGIHFGDRSADLAVQIERGTLGERGESFRRFVREDVVPFVEESYVCSDFSTIVGVSSATAFVHSFLFDDEPTFNGYIALGHLLMPTDEPGFVGLVQSTIEEPIEYFLGTAGAGSESRIRTGAKLAALFETLPRRSDFTAQHRRIAEVDDQSLALHGPSYGLEAVYRSFRPIHERFEGDRIEAFLKQLGDDDIGEHLAKHYADTSARFGVESSAPLFDIFVVGDAARIKDDEAMLVSGEEYFSELYPEASLIPEVIGRGYLALGNYAKAEEMFLKYRTYPDIAPTTFGFGDLRRVYEAQGEVDKLLELNLEGLAAFPDANVFRYRYGEACVKFAAEVEAGAAMLKEFIAAHGDDDSITLGAGYTMLGRAQVLLDQRVQAIASFEEALRLDPGDEAAVTALAELVGAPADGT